MRKKVKWYFIMKSLHLSDPSLSTDVMWDSVTFPRLSALLAEPLPPVKITEHHLYNISRVNLWKGAL